MTLDNVRRAGGAALVAATVGAGFAAPGMAQDWPTKAIHIVVPIAPGSVTDTLIRVTAERLSSTLGQPVVIDNRPGAATVIGLTECANAEPDGYTICLATHDGLSLNAQLMTNLPYDAKAFEPIMPLYFIGEGLMVPASLGIGSVEDLKAMAEADSSGLNFATLGSGSLADLFLRWLNDSWGTDIYAIPYGGGGPILQAVAQAEVQIALIGLGNYLPLKDQGTVTLLAVEMPERSPLFPDVPTFTEAGLGDWHAQAFWGLIAPPGTPDPVLDRIHDAFAELYEDPAYVAQLENSGMVPAAMSRDEFREYLDDYDASARELISKAQLEPKAYEAKP